MMTSADFHIPLLHMVYGGNINDAKQFGSVINELVNRYKQLTEACPRITLVFDKGNNSKENFESFRATEMHFVGSLKLNQCRELLKVPLREYRDLKGPGRQELKAYRTQQKLFAEQRTILITYNENLLASQLQGI
jgi:transposase